MCFVFLKVERIYLYISILTLTGKGFAPFWSTSDSNNCWAYEKYEANGSLRDKETVSTIKISRYSLIEGTRLHGIPCTPFFKF